MSKTDVFFLQEYNNPNHDVDVNGKCSNHVEGGVNQRDVNYIYNLIPNIVNKIAADKTIFIGQPSNALPRETNSIHYGPQSTQPDFFNQVCRNLERAQEYAKGRKVFMGDWSINQAFENGFKMVKTGTASDCSNIVF